MPFAAERILPSTPSPHATAMAGPAAALPRPSRVSPSTVVDADRLRTLQRLLSRAPFVLALVTGGICSFVTQHPAVVLSLMLGFPALLIAQEQVAQLLRRQPAAAQLQAPAGITATDAGSTPAAEGDASTRPSSPRRSLPRGMPLVTESASSGSASAAA